VPVFVGDDVDDGADPEPVEVEEEPGGVEFDGGPDAPLLTNAAMGGPGNVYGAPLLNTLGSKIPGSLSLYAPGMLTSSFACGVPVPDPPTLSWVQEG
jgi:hypothetical protein